VDWVLPMTERACVLCNQERADWEQAGMRIACALEETLENAFDKAATIERAVQCDVSIPPTRLPESLEDAREAAPTVGYPCVIKPRFSFTWDGASFLPHHDCAHVAQPDQLDAEVLRRYQAGNWPLVQGYVPGVGKGVFALCDQGRVVAWFAHERLREVRPTGSGSSLRRAIPLDPRLREPAERILGELRWHGPAMVEFRDDGIHPPWLMEINGRFWTSLELAIQAGVDFPRLWLEILAERPVETISVYRTDVTLRWLWGDMKHLMFVLAGRPRGYTGPFPSLGRSLRDVLGPQPPGTRAEIWQRADPWPALAEWLQGAREILSTAKH
jgi:predicted ATP-grasp superfamily ATP-dependent carboligase